MKKILTLVLCIAITVCVFTACSKNGGSDAESDSTSTSEKTTQTTIATEDAKIKEGDAIELIKSYSDKELGLSKDVRKECSFLVASSGAKIEKDLYVKVVAVIKHEKKDEKTGESSYQFDTKGEYYIRYDGKQILSKDMKTEKYSEMKVKKVPQTTTTKKESTKK